MRSASEETAAGNVAAIILCGGKSRRMGSDKSSLLLGEKSFLELTCMAMASIADPVVIVGRFDQEIMVREHLAKLTHKPEKFQFISDRVPDCGPLEALATGLDFLVDRAKAAFVTTCDAPQPKPDLFLFLLQELANFDAVVPFDERHIYGLTAVYRTGLAPKLRQLLNQGHRRIIDLPKFLNVDLINLEVCRKADPDLISFENVNTPEEYQSYRSKWRLHARGSEP